MEKVPGGFPNTKPTMFALEILQLERANSMFTLWGMISSIIKKEEMLTKEMIINSAKNAKPSFQKKWKQSEWLHGKQSSVADISSLDPALPNLGARLHIVGVQCCV